MRSKVSSMFWSLMGLACIAAVVILMIDVFDQSPALVALAQQAACKQAAGGAPASSAAAPVPAHGKLAKPGTKPAAAMPSASAPAACALPMTRWESNVLRRTMEFEGGGARYRIHCMRKYFLAGDYECQPAR